MNSDLNSYYSYRIKLEKAKQKTWILVVLARLLFILGIVITSYFR